MLNRRLIFRAFLPVLTLVSGCFPRGYNQGGASQTKDAKFSDVDFNTWFSSLSYGPIPNFEMTASVVFHKVGSELLPDFSVQSLPKTGLGDRLTTTSSGSLRGSIDGGTGMAWIRDYHPIAIRSRDEKAGGKVRFVGYLSLHQGRNSFMGTDMPTNQSDLLDPGLISIDHAVIGVEKESVSTVKMPLLLEGGNLVATGEFVFHSEHLFQQNSPDYFKFASEFAGSVNKESLEKVYVANGFYRPNSRGDRFEYRSPDGVHEILSKYIEVEKSKIVAVPSMPGEGTRHVDMFILPLGPRQIMIPEITDEGIATLAFEDEKVLARASRDFLNAISEKLRTELSIQVDRLPMLPPVFQSMVSGQRQGVFFSPANALLVNAGGDRRVVFLPHFEVPADWGNAFRDYAARVESEWRNYFDRLGWKIEFVTSNKAARSYGLLHCLTAQVPFVSERHLKRFQKLGY